MEDNIWLADLVDIRDYSAYNDHFKYLMTVIDVFSKYTWVVPPKYKKGNSVVEAFDSIVGTKKPSKLWADHGSEFYNKTVSDWLKKII